MNYGSPQDIIFASTSNCTWKCEVEMDKAIY